MISLGYVIGSIVAGVLALAAVAAVIWGRLLLRVPALGQYDDTHFGGRLLFWGGLGAFLLTVGIWTGATWPSFDMQYHSYRQVSGTVETVTSRFLGQDNGSTQLYVIKFAGDATAYRCDDSRCSLAKPGDTVHLRCIREWQYAGVSGWRCSYDQAG